MVNAGDGQHEHPSQALLDALSLCCRAFGRIDGLKVAICGDILHSRVARSNVTLLTLLGARVRLVGPPTLMPAEAQRWGVEVFHDMRRGVEGADVVMMLRLQLERMQGALAPSMREYFRLWGLDREKLARAAPGVRVMHPGPMNRGVEIDSDVADDLSVSLIQDQVEMGVAARMSVLASLAARLDNAVTPRPVAFRNVRLIDPESGYDGPGSLIVADGRIGETSRLTALAGLSDDIRVVDAAGALLCPGLVDLRVKTGEPGSEPKETLKSASRAAAAGGVTSIVVQPDTDPPIDDPAVADFILRRARDIGLIHVYPAGAATKGLAGIEMSEIGLLREAGCVYVTNVDRAIVDSRVMRRLLAYAGALGVLVAHQPRDPWLAAEASATEGEFAGRLGLAAEPVAAETIMLERDAALVELTGAPLLVDQISAAAPLKTLERAKSKGLPIQATASINHLSFNELDIGHYRTFCKLVPPLRSEDDRLSLIEAVASGLVDIVVSAHAPAPAEDKRLPFDEAAPGAIGLETFLSALLTLHHEGVAPLIRLISAASLAPARAIGSAAGRLTTGAPADLVLCDMAAPRLIDAAALISKSKNSAFDGRRLQGAVLMTLVDGRVVYETD